MGHQHYLIHVHVQCMISPQELDELSMGDHKQQLEMQTAELEHLCTNIETTRSRLEGTVCSIHS